MSVIFQLFRADYLSKLDESALNTLKQTVRQDFRVDEFVDTTRNTTLRLSQLVDPVVVDRVVARIQERARAVLQQLPLQPPPPNVSPGPFNPAQSLFSQFFSVEDLRRLTPHQYDILEMAISCEVTHFNGYVYLLEFKERFDQTILPLLGVRSPNPDTVYSPFNPDSPLYDLYNPPPP